MLASERHRADAVRDTVHKSAKWDAKAEMREWSWQGWCCGVDRRYKSTGGSLLSRPDLLLNQQVYGEFRGPAVGGLKKKHNNM